MKMEGDPQVTAWGVMRGQALDLIAPQQVVGGLFLMNAEEKACIALEILEEQGELMSVPHPLLSQHEGAGEGQPLGAGRCQPRRATAEPWTGEEDGRLTLYTLNLAPPDPAQNTPIYKPPTDDQMPPLIIVPPENAHLPPCPPPFSQESEQNLEVTDPPTADYILGVHSSLSPDSKSDRDACNDSLVSALGSHQVPLPVKSLSSDLEQRLQITSDVHQGSAVANDQIDPLESCLPLKTDQPCFVDLDVGLLPHLSTNHSLPQLEPSLEQLPHSETLVDRQETENLTIDQDTPPESPQGDLHLVPVRLPESESNVEPYPKQLRLTDSFLDTQIIPNHSLPQLEASLEQLSASETLVDMQETENFTTDQNSPPESPQHDPHLVVQLLESESVVEPYPKQFPLTESFVDTQINSCLVPDPDLAQPESVLDPEHLPQHESNLDPDPEQLPSPKSTVDNEELSHPDPDKMPQSESQFDLDPEQLSLPVVNKELSQSISHLDCGTEKVAQSEPYFDPATDHFPQSKTESCLTPDHDLPRPSESSLNLCVDTVESELLPSPEISVTPDLLPHSVSCLDASTDLLPLYDQLYNSETLTYSQPLRDCESDLLEYFCPEITQSSLETSEFLELDLDLSVDHSHHSLDSDIETFNLAESFMAHDTEQSVVSSLVLTTDQLTQPKLFLDSNLPDLNPGHLQQDLPHPESDKVPSRDPLPHSELSLDLLDHDPDQLPWFEVSMSSNIAPLPFSMHSLNEGESSMAYEADELSLCDPFLAPNHSEFLKSATCITDRLTLGNTYLEPDDGQSSTCESFSDVVHKTLPGPLMVPQLENLHQSEDSLMPDSEHLHQSDSILDLKTSRLTESCLDKLPKAENSLDSDHVTIPAPSETLDIEQLRGLDSNLADSVDLLQLHVSSMVPVSDQLLLVNSYMELDGGPNFESCLPMDDDLFFLSETFLAHDVDQIPVLDQSRSQETDQLPSSDPCLKPDDDQTLTLRPLVYVRLPQLETCMSPDNDQLPMSECPLSPCNDELSQVESYSGPNTNQLIKTEYCMQSENISDQLAQSEPSLGTDDDQSTLLEPCLNPNIDQLPQMESRLCQENEQLPQFECNLDPDHDNLSQSGNCLSSDSGQLSHCESSLYHSSDQLAQTEPHLVLSGDLLPELGTHLGLKSEEVSWFESEHPFSHESDCHQVSDSTQPNVFESTSSPNQIHLVASSHALFESPLSVEADQLSLSESFVTPNLDKLPLAESTVVPNTREMPLELLESSVPPTATQLLLLKPNSHSTMHLPLFDQLTISEPTEPPTTPHFYPSETPGTLPTTNVPLCDSSLTLNTPSNTNLSSITPEEFQSPWDWTLNLHPMDLSEVSLNGELPQNSAKQYDEPGDSFSIFCLDTPPDSTDVTPNLSLSEDLLSLCDVFSNLQTNDIIHSQSDQSTTNGLTDYPAEGDQCFNTTFQKDLESSTTFKSCSLHSANPALDHGFLNSESDQSDFYFLDLLFEPSSVSQEPESLASETLLQPNPRTYTEGVVVSTSSSDPSWLCSESQICWNGLSFVEKSLTSNSLDDSLLSQSESTFISSRFGQSSSKPVIDLDSLSLESPSESTQLPVIVVTDPFEFLSSSDDHTDNILSSNALLLDMSTSTKLEVDGDLQVVEVPSLEIAPELKKDRSEVSDCLDSSELSLCDGPPRSNQPQSDCVLGTILPSFMSTGELPGSPFEGIKRRSRDSQDSASVLLAFGEGDPFLAFSLDNDSPCAGDELARLRAVFDALDRDKDGFVKMEDFVQFATVYGAEQVKYLTGYLDPAGLGVINFRDFYRGISEIQNEDLDMQLYDMGYPSEEEPACSVDFDDLAAFEVTEVTDSAYVGSESAYSECETFTDEDTGGLAAQEDPETEGDGAGSRGHAPATPEGLELSLCDISGVTVTGQEEQFEDFGEGAEPDLFNSHCEEEQESFTQMTNTSPRLTSSGAPVSERQLLAPPPCSGLGGLYCSQCHKHINRLEDLSTRLRYLEMDSPDKRTSSRKEARRLHHSGFLEDQGEQPLTNMAFDDTDLTDKVLYLEQRVSELERDAAMTAEQQNRLRQENLQLLHRAHALEEQLKDQELLSDEVQSEETRKHRDELRKMDRDRGFQMSSLKARVQELESENTELLSQLPSARATTQRLEEEKYKLLDEVEEVQRQLKDHQEQNKKLGGKLSNEMHKQQLEKERCQEVIEELRRELEQTQLLRLEMEQRMGLGNSAALQEYNSRTREAELEHEVRRLKQEQRLLKEQNEELNGQIINLSIQGAKNLFSTTFSDSLAAEISSVSRDELMEAIQKQEEINLRLQDYIDRIIVAIMETNPAILEVKIH
ncbi:rab11 family-interacting protein 3 isoform X2 [Bufo bufo]|uniref:rab11 family-interacting protein 3 isoform X2 n=1 Tax=Bufo bufo TaxID=8384 RepID=UPI001ABDEEEB|nr:rab11 family-interacting protein 3 isoform X2 [Bufo bufo]